jgi:HK97 gp10 family phage protein
MARFAIDIGRQCAELQKQFERMGKAVQREELLAALEQGGEVVRTAANGKAPGPHVVMQRDKQQVPTLAVVSIGPDKEHWYYRFAETGAQPHEISPRTRKRLRAIKFTTGGAIEFARVVEHPGMGARPFLRPAVMENEQRAAEATAAALVKQAEAA